MPADCAVRIKMDGTGLDTEGCFEIYRALSERLRLPKSSHTPVASWLFFSQAAAWIESLSGLIQSQKTAGLRSRTPHGTIHLPVSARGGGGVGIRKRREEGERDRLEGDTGRDAERQSVEQWGGPVLQQQERGQVRSVRTKISRHE